MNLTEEEREFMEARGFLIGMGDPCSVKAEQYYRDIISRLVKENEELSKEKQNISNELILEGTKIYHLQAQLDAIKKAAEPIREEYNHNLEMDRSYFAGVPMKTLKEFVEALDKLIGGGK